MATSEGHRQGRPRSRPGSGLRRRLLLWLYSNRHIAGSLLACAGPGLLFAGVIREGWWAITAGLYAIGALLAPSPLHLVQRLDESLTLAELPVRLDALIDEVRPILGETALAHLAGIRTSVSDVLPRLEAQGQGGDSGELSFTLRETVMRYLPETLANYAALPPAFRVAHPLEGGRTARQLLDGQLALLDEQLRQAVLLVARGDAQALLANGRFLQDRFGHADFRAD